MKKRKANEEDEELSKTAAENGSKEEGEKNSCSKKHSKHQESSRTNTTSSSYSSSSSSSSSSSCSSSLSNEAAKKMIDPTLKLKNMELLVQIFPNYRPATLDSVLISYNNNFTRTVEHFMMLNNTNSATPLSPPASSSSSSSSSVNHQVHHIHQQNQQCTSPNSKYQTPTANPRVAANELIFMKQHQQLQQQRSAFLPLPNTAPFPTTSPKLG